MKLLLDTQALIYYVDQDHLLGPAAHAAITEPNNDLLLSAASIWEIAIKVGIGKLKLGLPFKPGWRRPSAILVSLPCRSRSITRTLRRNRQADFIHVVRVVRCAIHYARDVLL